MKAGIVVFPGSNCDRDCLAAVRAMQWDAVMCWHREALPNDLDLVILPGGFSHGDHLRAGALAARAPVMDDVRHFAERGGPVLGICNGFQILCEAGLLPGALRVNRDLRFHCEDAPLRVERHDTLFTGAAPEHMTLPIAHREGNYFADAATLARLEGEGKVVFRYERDVNGAANRIAGIINAAGNVCGLMPHPERACDPLLGNTAGRSIFESIAQTLAAAS